MAQTQLQKVRSILLTEGKISRNYCLANYVTSRLAARIDDLRHEGFVFEEKRVEGDFVYILKDKPAVPAKPRYVPKEVNGQMVMVEFTG